MASATISEAIGAPRKAVRAAWLLLLACTVALAHEEGDARVHLTKDEALQMAFPGHDRVERRTLFLEPAQQQALSQRARSPFDSRLQTVYEGWRDGELMGYAMIDTSAVRTKAATSLVVLGPDGRLRNMRILAWEEPPEYQPPQRWLDRFTGRSLDHDRLQVGRDVDAISGATLSVRMLAGHVRRALALHDVLLRPESNAPQTAALPGG